MLRAYRECYTSNGSAPATYPAIMSIQSTGGGISQFSVNRVYVKDMSPSCNYDPTFVHLICTGMPTGTAGSGIIEEHFYTSDASFPNGIALIGVPPASVWTFYLLTCCRAPSTNILNSTNTSYVIRARYFY
jgi:hypothetical protein